MVYIIYNDRKVNYEITNSIIEFIKLRFHMDLQGKNWVELVDILMSYRDSYFLKMIR